MSCVRCNAVFCSCPTSQMEYQRGPISIQWQPPKSEGAEIVRLLIDILEETKEINSNLRELYRQGI
jgi:hypothetical protein